METVRWCRGGSEESDVGSRRVMSRHCGTNAGCAKSGVISRSIFPLYSSAALREVFCAGCAKSEDGKDSCSMGGRLRLWSRLRLWWENMYLMYRVFLLTQML